METNNNSADFSLGAPAPRNSASPINSCQYTLAVSANPAEGGSVERSPDQANHQLGTTVQVTAVRAYGYHFIGWSGDASGTVNPITVVMDGSKTIVANFRLTTVSGIVVISQVFGGGGNTGAAYLNDYVELYHRGNATIDVTGWSVQYASADGSTWFSTTLIGSIPAGGYYLVPQAEGSGGNGVALPTADAIGTTDMSAIEGKVALVSNSTTLTEGCPTGVSIMDFLGYGGADCSEASPTGALSNLTAAFRNDQGCMETENNLADFASASPAPRNSASPKNFCDEWTAVNDQPNLEFALGAASPNPSRGVMRIPFALPREADVRLRVLDVQGRVAASIAEGTFTAGRHEVVWSGMTRSGAAHSGIYFIQMNLAGKDFVRRVAITN